MTGRKKTLKKKQFKCFCPTHVCTTPVVQEMTSAPHRSPPLPLLAPLLLTVWHCQGCRYLRHNHSHFCCYCYLFLVDCCLPLHCLCFHHHCLPPLLPLLAANTVATVRAAAITAGITTTAADLAYHCPCHCPWMAMSANVLSATPLKRQTFLSVINMSEMSNTLATF